MKIIDKLSIEQLREEFKSRMDQFPLVRIEFLDHARCGGDKAAPGVCEAVGRLVAKDSHTYYLASWIFDSEADEHTDVYPVVKTKGHKLFYLTEKN